MRLDMIQFVCRYSMPFGLAVNAQRVMGQEQGAQLGPASAVEAATAVVAGMLSGALALVGGAVA